MFRFLAWIQPGRWPRSKKPFIIFKRALIRSSESGRCRGLRSRLTRRNSTASGLKSRSRGSRERGNYSGQVGSSLINSSGKFSEPSEARVSGKNFPGFRRRKRNRGRLSRTKICPGSPVVRHGSAKPLYAGSIPAQAFWPDFCAGLRFVTKFSSLRLKNLEKPGTKRPCMGSIPISTLRMRMPRWWNWFTRDT